MCRGAFPASLGLSGSTIVDHQSPHNLILGFSNFAYCTALYAFSFTLPTIVKNMGFTAAQAQAMSAPPYFIALLAIAACGLLTDKYRQRSLAIIIPGFVGFVGMLICMTTADKKHLVPLTCEFQGRETQKSKRCKRRVEVPLTPQTSRVSSSHAACTRSTQSSRHLWLCRTQARPSAPLRCQSASSIPSSEESLGQTSTSRLKRVSATPTRADHAHLLTRSDVQDGLWHFARGGLCRMCHHAGAVLGLDRPNQQAARANVG